MVAWSAPLRVWQVNTKLPRPVTRGGVPARWWTDVSAYAASGGGWKLAQKSEWWCRLQLCASSLTRRCMWPAESERFTDGVEEVFLEGEDEDDDVPLGMIFPTSVMQGTNEDGEWGRASRQVLEEYEKNEVNDHFKMRTVAN